MDNPPNSQAFHQQRNEAVNERFYNEKIAQLKQLINELRELRHPKYIEDLKDLIRQLQEQLEYEEIVKDLQIESTSIDVPAQLRDLKTRLERAKKFHLSGDSYQAYQLSRTIFTRENLHKESVPIHVALLVELKKSNELFTLAHKLVDRRPEWALSWYTVGCYYLCIGNLTVAKRFLAKCTSMDQTFGDGWVLFGHVFAMEGEHDQSMNCYLKDIFFSEFFPKASRLLPGRHEPLLYLGMEYAFANNRQLAADFLKEAADLAGDDPRVLHEQGCIAYCLDRNYPEANRLFRMAIRLIYNSDDVSDLIALLGKPLSQSWEPLVNNLGHVSRKLRLFDEAVIFHRKSLLLRPRRSSTLLSLGLAYICTGQIESGLDCLHQSLTLKPNNVVAKSLLRITLEAVDSCSQLWTNGPTFVIEPKPRLSRQAIVKVARNDKNEDDSVIDRSVDSVVQCTDSADDVCMELG